MGEIFQRVAPSKPLEWTGERLTSAVSGQIEIEHLHRYFFARQLCRGLDVLDIAAGEGYGTALLAQTAKTAVGVEIAAEAVGHAAAAYRLQNLRYVQGDARAIPVADASVDAVISFETIEHFYEQDQFLLEVKRVLRPGGFLVVSSPDRDVYSPPGTPANPYHAAELARDEFAQLLQRHFRQVAVLAQRTLVGSALIAPEQKGRTVTFERRGPDHFEASAGLPRAPYMVALASDADLAAVPSSLYLERDDVGAVLSHADAYPELAKHFEAAQSGIGALQAAAESCRQELTQERERAAGEAESRATEIGHWQSALASREAELSALHRELERTKAEAQAAQADLAASVSQRELEEAKAETEAARAELAAACTQRDVARAALRQAAIRAGAAAQRQQMEIDRLQESLREGELWRLRYHNLRHRVELILSRSGLLPMSRILVPRPMRQLVLRTIRSRTQR